MHINCIMTLIYIYIYIYMVKEAYRTLINIFSIVDMRCLFCSCLIHISCVIVILVLPRSYRDTKQQFGGVGAQSALTPAPSTRLQALLCVPGQILWVPLWSQCLRGVQGKPNTSKNRNGHFGQNWLLIFNMKASLLLCHLLATVLSIKCGIKPDRE